jgi:hypothetical protein
MCGLFEFEQMENDKRKQIGIEEGEAKTQDHIQQEPKK